MEIIKYQENENPDAAPRDCELFLAALGLLVEIRIPGRYGRHIMVMTEG